MRTKNQDDYKLLVIEKGNLEAIRLSEEMLGQWQSEKWMQERKKQITASMAGGIIKMRAKTK